MKEKLPPDDPPVTRTEAEGATVDLPEGLGFFTTGQVLGERYEILEMLGRGGMGEVWRAFDLKLRVEVGLKALRDDLFQSERRLELLRQEVRAAREVVSPNVCRIFDLIEIDGRELVSMEYVDGATLLGVLQERGPLELKEAQDIASQFLAGLEAIHKAGLVHRDVKPENIMLTRAGRVVVMDFGLARGPESGAGSVSGTPAYMAPEHAAGQEVDARADVYSAGVVLAEMVSPEGIKSYQSRQSVWEGVRSEPAKVPDSPWAPVIQRAVARDRERRQNSAHTLIRELEDVTLRVEGADDLHPYPGLASFTEADAEYFFGREAEVEQVWRKLEGPPRLLGIMGPSGAGKTSFIRAGLTPNVPPDWQIIRCTPGAAAVSSLAGVVARETAGDPDVAELLPRFDDPDVALQVLAAWMRAKSHSLLVVDQFEELFTQNSAEQQRRFADLLRRFVLECDIHVLLSMRDDFAASCNAFESLRPIYHELTVLDPPAGPNLRRALVQPATKCGYRFEDDELVEEILAEVEGERGALPLLAFALARLWEKRDRDTGLLTRQAYHDIGGVGGALARHAEATVDRIGVERIPIVRELFRNLVTAEGTRAVREWDELLSVFERSALPPVASKGLGVRSQRPSLLTATEGSGLTPHSSPARDAAADVLRELIDARLLTSYEVREDEHEPTRRVEIIHESLLANWPRLVRWQTQDQEGAQLRDELRQAARTWDEHNRTEDFLWTGTAYREFQLWRERYPGGLTENEEAFATAMRSFANRRRRRRRFAAAAAVVVIAAVALVFAGLWRRSVEETRRAEAANLLSRAQLQLESYPSAALAYAAASLELSDSMDTRLLALEALWKGPTAFVLDDGRSWEIEFTLDGQWLVQATDETPFQMTVFGADGSVSPLQDVHDAWVDLVMDTSSGYFATLPAGNDESWALWSAPEKRLLAQKGPSAPFVLWGAVVDSTLRRVVVVIRDGDEIRVETFSFDGEHKRLGALPFTTRRDDTGGFSTIAVLEPASGRRLFVLRDHAVYVFEVGDKELGSSKRLDHIEATVANHGIAIDPRGRFIAARHQDGLIRIWDLHGKASPIIIPEPPGVSSLGLARDGSLLEAKKFENNEVTTWVWSLEGEQPRLLRRNDLGINGAIAGWTLDPVERRLVSILNPDSKIRLWPLSAPEDAEPVVMQRGVGGARRVRIHPNGQWLASSFTNGLTVWPLSRRYPIVIDRYEDWKVEAAFGPRGEWLATTSVDSAGTVRLWQLEGDNLPAGRVLAELDTYAYGLAVSPHGKSLLVGSHSQGAQLLSLDGRPPRRLPGDETYAGSTAISQDGRLGAASSVQGSTGYIHIWNLETVETFSVIELSSGMGEAPAIRFAADHWLLAGSDFGLVRLDTETGERETIYDGRIAVLDVSGDGSLVIFTSPGEDATSGTLAPLGRAIVLDLETRAATTLEAHGDRVVAVALDPSGDFVVTGDLDGVIRVGPLDGREPHLLLGSPGEVFDLAVDPKGRWIASTGGNELRLWPMPDLSKPPLHTLPRDELIAKLKTLTNIRVVRDEESATGWKLTHDPFPGWETVPTW